MEAGLTAPAAGLLHKEGTIKRYDKVLERVGRLREKNARVAQDYRIEVIVDADKHHATFSSTGSMRLTTRKKIGSAACIACAPVSLTGMKPGCGKRI